MKLFEKKTCRALPAPVSNQKYLGNYWVKVTTELGSTKLYVMEDHLSTVLSTWSLNIRLSETRKLLIETI